VRSLIILLSLKGISPQAPVHPFKSVEKIWKSFSSIGWEISLWLGNISLFLGMKWAERRRNQPDAYSHMCTLLPLEAGRILVSFYCQKVSKDFIITLVKSGRIKSRRNSRY
ncbi:unnamed protein product, partial [Allacma fusca]